MDCKAEVAIFAVPNPGAHYQPALLFTTQCSSISWVSMLFGEILPVPQGPPQSSHLSPPIAVQLLSPRTQNSVRNHRGTHKSLHYVAVTYYIHCQFCQRLQRRMESLLYCQTITSLVVTLAEALTVYLLKISAPPRAIQDRISLCSPWLSWHSVDQAGTQEIAGIKERHVAHSLFPLF